MKPINIFTFPANKTYQKLAKYFSNEKSNSLLPILEIPDCVGNGNILAMDIYNDLSIIILNGFFEKTTYLNFKTEREDSLNFIYNYKSPLEYRFNETEKWNALEQFQPAVSSTSNQTYKRIKLKAEESYFCYIISISKSTFLDNRRYCTKTLSGYLRFIFENDETNYHYPGSYNLQIADIFNRIKLCDYSAFEDRVFLEATTHELINQHFIHFKKDIEKKQLTSKLSAYEVKAIHQAAQYIEHNITEIETVSQIARNVGLNNNKLQLGFNELYNLSVNRFIRNVRMQKARDLLMNSEENISQIVHAIGLKSNSYFSRLFREKYKIAPSIFRIKSKTEGKSI